MSNMDRQREIFRQACLDIGDNLYGECKTETLYY